MPYAQLPPGTVDPHLIEAMIAGARKSKLRAYMLWYLMGGVGVHNFYLGRPLIGSLQIAALLAAVSCLGVAVHLDAETPAGEALGIAGLAIGAVWILSVVLDGFLIPRRVRAHSDRLRAELLAQAGLEDT